MSGGWSEATKRFYDVMLAWEASSPADIDSTSPADAYRNYFSRTNAQVLRKHLNEYEKARGEVKINYVQDCFLPAPIATADGLALYPVVMFGFGKRDDMPNMNVRIVTYYEQDARLYASGWRFELPDGGPDGGPGTGDHFHHFPHVQAISSWQKIVDGSDDKGFHAPFWYDPDVNAGLNRRHVLESRPAFPIPCTTPAGVIVCVIAALYGSNGARRILENYPAIPPPLLEEIRQIVRIDI
ncbi:hypothetical protein [Curtobacterium sp. 20TX0008]|uniref:hypothetical protein n=1 Tax=Curtobacterium sp. 20TX0008 TaxID=3022018 RepID=UPI00232ECB3F|nr:hypothetical protein [Curtobacterium sp. 20TX0008]MDB6427100.1 hypothetical protein [Curtobacterium sp. 20TX0008]